MPKPRAETRIDPVLNACKLYAGTGLVDDSTLTFAVSCYGSDIYHV